MDLGDSQTIGVRLGDTGPGGGPKTEVGVSVTPAAISTHPEGVETAGGRHPPVLLDVYEGVVRLFVWVDTDAEQPTHAVFFKRERASPAVTREPPRSDEWRLE